MKKLFTLLTLALMSIGTAWAEEDVTVFSAVAKSAWSVPAGTEDGEITSDYATISGGKMYVTNKQTSAKDLIKDQKGMAFQMTNNDTFFKVVLDKALEAGDKISVRMQTRTDAELGIWFSKETARPTDEPKAIIICAQASAQSWETMPIYTVIEGDGICGETTFYLYRHTGKSTYFTDFTITRSISDRTEVTLSFEKDSYSVNLNESFSAPTLTVDPSAAESEVIYESSNTAVAKVDASTGAVEILGAGNATITASISDSETYKNASASYKLIVTDPNSEGFANAEAIIEWPFQDGTTLTPETIVPANAFLSTSVSYGSLTLGKNEAVTFKGDETSYVFNTLTNSTGGSLSNINVDFVVTPMPGVSFKPTNVYLEAARLGHGNGKLTLTAIYGDGTTKTLKAEHEVARNNTDGYTAYTTDDIAIADGVASNKAFTLRITINKLDNNKADALRNIKITGEVNGAPEAVTTYAITVESSDAELGTVNGGGNIIANEKTTLSATAATGAKFVKWQKDGEDFEGNTSVNIEVIAVADAIYTAIFKKLYMISFTAGEGDKGTTPHALAVEYQETSYTTPAKNYYISKSGATVTGWTDGTNNYGFGQEITLSGDIELSPIFTNNTKTVADATAATEVTWEFRRSKGAPFLNIENATGYYVTQKEFDGETIDLPIYINNLDNSGYEGKRGKTNNTSSDAQTQVNAGSKFTLPAVKGMKISINAANAFDTETGDNKYITTIGGVDMSDYLTSSKKGIVYTYEGSDETVDIIFGSGFGYLYNIVVAYPAAVGSPVEVAFGSTGYATFCSKSAVDFSDAAVTVYTAKVNGSNAVLAEVESKKVPANTGVILKGSDTVSGTVIAEADALTNNDLIAATSDVTTTGIYILVPDGESVKFTTMIGGTLKAGKAYLPAASSARELNLVFGEATGISEMKNVNTSAEVYNLNGMRIAQPTKGLYIQNGKKMIVK